MADVIQQDDDHHQTQESCNTNTSSLIEQISQQLNQLRQDDLELTEKLMSVYDGLCHLRQTLTNSQINSTTDISTTIPIQIDSPTSSRYHTKQRSDSEPNILSDRRRMITVTEELQ
ncbi:unnamed protein product [Adineta steineri]|uniref:Uncharacterized protein n=1 Tax=Adineta steineri TaxID=433720 RepID=A0A816FG81_9BILA|nr:unnamed protein product [Adineta steineri]CAF1661091.1 unnamed protein product [Adineta steineri]